MHWREQQKQQQRQRQEVADNARAAIGVLSEMLEECDCPNTASIITAAVVSADFKDLLMHQKPGSEFFSKQRVAAREKLVKDVSAIISGQKVEDIFCVLSGMADQAAYTATNDDPEPVN